MRRLSLIICLLCAALTTACCFRAPQEQVLTPSPEGIELPASDADEDIVRHVGYTASYNHQTLVSDWVAYELTREELKGQQSVQRNFSRDPAVKFPKASREDYSRSGWDKGHMAARADMKWSEQALIESDYFTNICPQDHHLNAGLWNRIEGVARRAAKRYGAVFIVTGPLFTTHEHGTIGDAQVQVPDGFYKALLVNSPAGYKAVAFIVPNSPCGGSEKNYAVTVDSLEQRLGRDLYPLLPAADVEASYNWNDWKN